MQKRIIFTDEKKRELNKPIDGRFPLHIEHENIQDFLRCQVPFHWHPELEMAFVTKGSIICQANGATYRLTEGTGIFFNTNVLHAYMQDDDNGCLYKAILCDISLLFGPPGSLIYERYIAPFLSDTTRSSILLDSSSSWQRELIDTAVSMADKDLQQAPFLELSLLEGITKIWRLLCEHTGAERPASSRSVRDITRMKAAMAYIQEHCGGSISLAELASVCSLSQSECCRLFRRILHQSPNEYVISCRISKSLGLLAEGRLSMTEIAGLCGFQSSSYFSETFKKVIGMSPRDYKYLVTPGSGV
ncbi:MULTISPECIES: AraC family transcriptional regulator [unclassified Candidatus Paralachnospira]|uniref:AraC family transcriptional regulator n=1 Tax=unclassified Candidatus Paralachnospira TaxID=3099471 RepID=UPI003F90FDA2